MSIHKRCAQKIKETQKYFLKKFPPKCFFSLMFLKSFGDFEDKHGWFEQF